MGRSLVLPEDPNRPDSLPAQGIIIMGVAGTGKTSVGKSLSGNLGWTFLDGDDYHSQENVAKMAAGQPLSDQDRLPWLAALHDLIRDHLREGRSLILACSALRENYREVLAAGLPTLIFVHLTGEFELIFNRLASRGGHYLKPEMLQSQFDILEPPKQAITVDIEQSLEAVTSEILVKLGRFYPEIFPLSK